MLLIGALTFVSSVSYATNVKTTKKAKIESLDKVINQSIEMETLKTQEVNDLTSIDSLVIDYSVNYVVKVKEAKVSNLKPLYLYYKINETNNIKAKTKIDPGLNKYKASITNKLQRCIFRNYTKNFMYFVSLE